MELAGKNYSSAVADYVHYWSGFYLPYLKTRAPRVPVQSLEKKGTTHSMGGTVLLDQGSIFSQIFPIPEIFLNMYVVMAPRAVVVHFSSRFTQGTVIRPPSSLASSQFRLEQCGPKHTNSSWTMPWWHAWRFFQNSLTVDLHKPWQGNRATDSRNTF